MNDCFNSRQESKSNFLKNKARLSLDSYCQSSLLSYSKADSFSFGFTAAC